MGAEPTRAVLAGLALSLVACVVEHPSNGPARGDRPSDAHLHGAGLTELQKQYQRGIQDAAVRHPEWNIPLWSFGDAPTVLVSTFTDDPALDTTSQVNWVAPTAQVRPRCKGQSNAILFLEELLGLPPQVEPNPGKRWHVYTFEISQKALSRPCPGGVDSSQPSAPRCIAGSAVDPHLDDASAQFLLQQFWYSHRAPTLSGDTADFGFPWTGMGWTYDWNPNSRSHFGVSEFVVRKGAEPINPRGLTPAEFCAGSG